MSSAAARMQVWAMLPPLPPSSRALPIFRGSYTRVDQVLSKVAAELALGRKVRVTRPPATMLEDGELLLTASSRRYAGDLAAQLRETRPERAAARLRLALDEADGPVSTRELASRLKVSTSRVRQLLAELGDQVEVAGHDPNDRRIPTYSLRSS